MAYVSKIKVGSDTLLVGSNLYGECSTAADVAAKVVNISGFAQLSSGVTIHVKFDNTNKALSPTLNVSSTGAKPIYRQGKITPSISVSSSWADRAIVSLTYNTSNISTGCWVMNDVNIDPSEDVSYITNLTPYLLRPTCDGLIRGSGYNKETDEIVGGTVAWNQLLNPADFAASDTDFIDGVKITNNADGSVTINVAEGGATASRFYNLHSTRWTFPNHTIYGGQTPENIVLCNTYSAATTAFSNTIYKNTYIAVQAFRPAIWVKSGCAAGTYKIYPKLHDLTLAFGSTIADYVYTLETATAGSGIAWLHKYGFFNKPYYPYNAGELLSVKTSAHKMVGFNAWDEQWKQGYYNSSTGEFVSGGNYIASKNMIKVLPSTKYFYNIPNIFQVLYYDADKNFIRADNSVNPSINPSLRLATTPNNAYYVNFYVGGTYGTTYKNDICFNLHWDGERDGEYAPYVEYTYPLDDDLELRGIPKLDANNNLYYDGDEYASDGTVTRRYGIIDLGSLEWLLKYTINEHFFEADFTNAVKNRAEAFICTKWYANAGYVTSSEMPDKSAQLLNQSGHGRIWINDSDYTDTATFKTAMSGVMLVYELATPTTESAEPYTNPQIVDDFGTEEYIDEREVPIPVGHNTTYDSISILGPNVINKTLILQYS